MQKLLLKFSVILTALTMTGSLAHAHLSVRPADTAPALAPSIPVESYYVEFGSVMVNTQQFRNYVITNDGTTPMTIKSAEIGGAGYDAEYDCTTLAPKATCNLQISFWPAFKGMESGRLVMLFDTDEMIFDLDGTGY